MDHFLLLARIQVKVILVRHQGVKMKILDSFAPRLVCKARWGRQPCSADFITQASIMAHTGTGGALLPSPSCQGCKLFWSHSPQAFAASTDAILLHLLLISLMFALLSLLMAILLSPSAPPLSSSCSLPPRAPLLPLPCILPRKALALTAVLAMVSPPRPGRPSLRTCQLVFVLHCC